MQVWAKRLKPLPEEVSPADLVQMVVINTEVVRDLVNQSSCDLLAQFIRGRYIFRWGGPGIPEISSLLLGSRSAESDRRNFFKTQVLYWMLCATDGHAKNFSLFIEKYGRFLLTPLYDILSAYTILGEGKSQLATGKAKMAMAVTNKDRHCKWAEIRPDTG